MLFQPSLDDVETLHVLVLFTTCSDPSHFRWTIPQPASVVEDLEISSQQLSQAVSSHLVFPPPHPPPCLKIWRVGGNWDVEATITEPFEDCDDTLVRRISWSPDGQFLVVTNSKDGVRCHGHALLAGGPCVGLGVIQRAG